MPISMGIITSQKISPSCCLFIHHGLGCQPPHNETLPMIFVDILTELLHCYIQGTFLPIAQGG